MHISFVFRSLCLVAGCCALVGFASAAEARPEKMGASAADRFALMDKNSDGKVTREEFIAAMPQMREEAFNAIDANADNAITLPEWEGFSMGHAQGQTGGMPPQNANGTMPQGMGGMMPPKGMGGGMAPQSTEGAMPPQGAPAMKSGNGTAAPGLLMPSRKAQ